MPCHGAAPPHPRPGGTVQQLVHRLGSNITVTMVRRWRDRAGGEVVRRATGEPISQVLREHVAGPLGVADELFFGVPAFQLNRGPGCRTRRQTNVLAAMPEEFFTVSPRGVMPTARAVARMYAALLGEVDGVRLVSPQRLRELSRVTVSGVDEVMGHPTAWALGYGIGRPGSAPHDTASVFGMVGIGGTAAYADTATGTSFALTKNRFSISAVARIGEIVAKAVADG